MKVRNNCIGIVGAALSAGWNHSPRGFCRGGTSIGSTGALI